MDVVVGFSDKASKGLKNVGSQFSKTSKSITGGVSKFISKVGLFAGVGGIAGVGLAVSKAVSTFSSFEKAVANAASVTGATGKAFEDTKKHIAAVSKELGESTVFSASQAASAFYDLASAGYDVANMTKGDLQPILNLAAATQTDLTKTTEVTTSTLGQFGLGIESSGRIADVFAKTIGGSKATVEKLDNSLKSVGPIANSMGMDIESVNGILGNLYNAGFKGEQAGTALRGAFSSLLNPVGQGAEALTALGLSVEDVNPATHDFADVLDTLTAAGMDTNSAMKLFGVEAAPAMLALTDNTDGIRDLTSDLKDAGGTAETMAKEQLATFSGSITLLKSALEGVAITIGKKVAPYIKALAEWLTKVIPPTMELAGRVKDALMPAFTKISDWIKDAIPKIKEFIKTLVDKLKPTFDSLKDIVGSLIKIFNNLFGGMTSHIDIFKTSASAVLSLIDVFAALSDAIATVLGWFAKHKDITLFISVLGGVAIVAIGIPILLAAISAGFAILAASAATAAATVIAATAPISLPIIAIGAAIALLAVAWRHNWFGIRDVVGNVAAAISGMITTFIADVKTAISVFLAALSTLWSSGWDGIKTYLITWGANMVTSVETLGKDLITALVDGISGALSGVWDIITGETSVTSTIIGGLNSILPGAKAQGNDVSTNVSTGITDKLSDVTTATTSVTDALHTQLEVAPTAAKITGNDTMLNMALGITDKMSDVITAAGTTKDDVHTELEKAPPAAKKTGLDAMTAMAEGIESGTSAVSEAAASVVDAATAEMDRLWAQKQADWDRKSASDAADAAKKKRLMAGEAQGNVLKSLGETGAEYWTATGGRLGSTEVGASGAEMKDWVASLPGNMYIPADIWDSLSDDVKTILKDKVAGILATDVNTTTSRRGVSGIIKSSILGTASEYESGGTAMQIAQLEAEKAYAQSQYDWYSDRHHPNPQNISISGLSKQIADLTLQIAALESSGSYAKGGYIDYDQNASIHKGEYVIPARGAPVLSGGKDINLNITYNIGDIIGIDDLQSILGQHDQKLLQKLQSLI